MGAASTMTGIKERWRRTLMRKCGETRGEDVAMVIHASVEFAMGAGLPLDKGDHSDRAHVW